MDLAGGALRSTLGRRLPLTDGVVTLNGISRPVLIRRDEFGVPYIEAQRAKDAWYGLGFAMGQDRAFQCEVMKRISTGRLSELVGSDGLEIDRLSRRIGFAHIAREQFGALDETTRTQLQSFGRGLTDGTSVGLPKVPHEFALLRSRPTPFTGLDVLAIVAFNAFMLAANWEHELARLFVLTLDGPQALAAIDPTYAEHLPVTAPPAMAAGATIEALAEDLEHLRQYAGPGASNNWAVAGSRTATGRPIVANDPHLPPMLPTLWYLAQVRCPDWAVAGATLVGTPGFAAAHNGHGAWGATSGHSDNTDLFLVDVGPDRRSIRIGGDLVPCDVRTERIDVRGAEHETLEVLETPHGPVVGPALGDGSFSIAIKGTWAHARRVTGLLDAPRTTTFEEFRELFRDWPGMQLNLVWGDTTGTIGWQLVGELPVRRRGNGTLPQDGSDPGVGWETDAVPFDDLPYATDPELGFLATANNKPVRDDDAKAFLGVDWLEGYRAAAIAEQLADRDDWDVRSTLALQLDVRSLPWLEIRDVIVDRSPADADARKAVALLRAWDGHVRAESPAATIYELLTSELAVRIMRAKAPRAADWMLGKAKTPMTNESLLALKHVSLVNRLVGEQPDGWFDDGWDAQIEHALAVVVRRLRAEFGDEVLAWAWGDVRPLVLRHLVSDGAPAAIAAIFDRGPLRIGGDAHTIPQAGVPPLDPLASPNSIATLRMAIDVGNWESSRWALPGGVSGNPFSPHYDDQLELWEAGRGIRIAFSPDEVERAAVSQLRILPAWTGPRKRD